MRTIAVTQRLTVDDEGVGHEGRCHACGSIYKSALFIDRSQVEAHVVVECPCGQQVEMHRIGTVRHKSEVAPLPVFEGMK